MFPVRVKATVGSIVSGRIVDGVGVSATGFSELRYYEHAVLKNKLNLY